MKYLKRILGGVLTLCLLFLLCGTAAAELPLPDLSRTGAIGVTLRAPDSGMPLTKTEVFLLQVADRTLTEYTLLQSFEACGVEINGDWSTEKAVHLAAYAREHDLPWLRQETDAEGKALFEGLPLGLYVLAIGELPDSWEVVPPALVTVPMANAAGDQWIYQVDATPKLQLQTSKEPGNLAVRKLWLGEGPHPGAATVQLLKNGVVADTVILSEENHWRHIWTGLDSDSSWSVTELRVPEAYQASYVKAGQTITVVNAERPDTAESVTRLTVKKQWEDRPGSGISRPDHVMVDLLENGKKVGEVCLSEDNHWTHTWTDLPIGRSWSVREQPGNGQYLPSYHLDHGTIWITNTQMPPEKPEEVPYDSDWLPMTGQLQWPIPVLVLTGLVLFVIGFCLQKLGGSHEKRKK